MNDTPTHSTGTQGSTAFFTDMYELTMLDAAIKDGTAQRDCIFEVFGRRMPNERRYGVVAGTERVLDAITKFRFTKDQLETCLLYTSPSPRD